MRNTALKVLNFSGGDRQRELAVAIERLRWLERDPPATRIDVNIATARLTYWHARVAKALGFAVKARPELETTPVDSGP